MEKEYKMSILNKKQEKLVKKQIKEAKKRLPTKKEIEALKKKVLHKHEPKKNNNLLIGVLGIVGVIAVTIAGTIVTSIVKGTKVEKV
jgi:hypothetical protein